MYLFQYRDLLRNLVVADLKVKYASSMLGFAWSLLNPLMMMLILYLVFSNVYKSTQENFILYILIGILTWRFFSLGTVAALMSIVSKPGLVTKVYIPREILTLSSVLSSLISSILEFIVLMPLLLVFGVGFHWTILLFPAIMLLLFLLVYGVSLILASFYVYFRDLNHIWDVLIQLGFFLCPIVYPLSMIPGRLLPFYLFNPVTVLMNMFRDIFLNGTVPHLSDFFIPVIFTVAILMVGSVTFSRLSRRFAEEV